PGHHSAPTDPERSATGRWGSNPEGVLAPLPDPPRCRAKQADNRPGHDAPGADPSLRVAECGEHASPHWHSAPGRTRFLPHLPGHQRRVDTGARLPPPHSVFFATEHGRQLTIPRYPHWLRLPTGICWRGGPRPPRHRRSAQKRTAPPPRPGRSVFSPPFLSRRI